MWDECICRESFLEALLNGTSQLRMCPSSMKNTSLLLDNLCLDSFSFCRRRLGEIGQMRIGGMTSDSALLWGYLANN